MKNFPDCEGKNEEKKRKLFGKNSKTFRLFFIPPLSLPSLQVSISKYRIIKTIDMVFQKLDLSSRIERMSFITFTVDVLVDTLRKWLRGVGLDRELTYE